MGHYDSCREAYEQERRAKPEYKRAVKTLAVLRSKMMKDLSVGEFMDIADEIAKIKRTHGL